MKKIIKNKIIDEIILPQSPDNKKVFVNQFGTYKKYTITAAPIGTKTAKSAPKSKKN